MAVVSNATKRVTGLVKSLTFLSSKHWNNREVKRDDFHAFFNDKIWAEWVQRESRPPLRKTGISLECRQFLCSSASSFQPSSPTSSWTKYETMLENGAYPYLFTVISLLMIHQCKTMLAYSLLSGFLNYIVTRKGWPVGKLQSLPRRLWLDWLVCARHTRSGTVGVSWSWSNGD